MSDSHASDTRAAFRARLQERWIPELRALGFRGSNSDFRRTTGDFVHCINIQGRREGGSCCVNLGVHPVFLPIRTGPRTIRNIREIDCALRARLTPSGIDHWWPYSTLAHVRERVINYLMATYRTVGEPLFQRFTSLLAVFGGIEPAEFEVLFRSGGIEWLEPFWLPDDATALLLSTVYHHLGDHQRGRAMAEAGMRLCRGRRPGHGLLLELQRLATRADPAS